jgi:hypothetical protein
VETAQAIVQELLAEKGQRGVRVISTVIGKGRTVRLVFTAAEPQTPQSDSESK